MSTFWAILFAWTDSKAASSSPHPALCKVILGVLKPSSGRVYDPCYDSGGMFVQNERVMVRV